MTGPHFGMIPRWLAPLDLTGREFRVLLVIASHAGKASREPRPDGGIETRIARIGTERIADEANLDRRNVQRAIRQLEAKGILERLHESPAREFQPSLGLSPCSEAALDRVCRRIVAAPAGEQEAILNWRGVRDRQPRRRGRYAGAAGVR
jgi:DNA-binding MarR family transcriptional regulator